MSKRLSVTHRAALIIIISYLFFKTIMIFGKNLLEIWDPVLIMFSIYLGCSLVLIFSLETGNKIKKIFHLPKPTILGLFITSLLADIVAPVLYLYGLRATMATNLLLLLNILKALVKHLLRKKN